jgi:hypothetical protein
MHARAAFLPAFFYQFVLIVHFAQAYDALMKAFVDRNKVK